MIIPNKRIQPVAVTSDWQASVGQAKVKIPGNGSNIAQQNLPPLPDTLPTPGQHKPDEHDIATSHKAEQLPPIEDLSAFIMKPIIKAKVLVEGILHQSSKLCFGGNSKAFKTWMMLDLALSVANQVEWLGLTTTQAKVLYCNFEIQEEHIQSRIKALEQAKNITTSQGQFDLWNLRGYAASFDVLIPKILERIKTMQYGLIVIDPIYKMYGDTDENAAGDVAALMNGLERLAVNAKAAVVFSAHYSKGNQSGKESIDRVSGSGVFARDPDSLIAVTALEEDECFKVEPTLRNFKPMAPFGVRWQYPLIERDNSLNIKKLRTSISKQPLYTVRDLLVCLVDGSKTKKDLKQASITATDMGDSTFNKLLKQMESAEGIRLDPSTKKYSYTPPHRDTLT